MAAPPTRMILDNVMMIMPSTPGGRSLACGAANAPIVSPYAISWDANAPSILDELFLSTAVETAVGSEALLPLRGSQLF